MVKRRGHAVVLHYVDVKAVGFDKPNQRMVAERLLADNAPRLAATPTEITYVGWLQPWKRVTREGKPSMLVVELDNDRAGNVLIRQGAVLGGKNHKVSWYDREQQIQQCFGC